MKKPHIRVTFDGKLIGESEIEIRDEDWLKIAKANQPKIFRNKKIYTRKEKHKNNNYEE